MSSWQPGDGPPPRNLFGCGPPPRNLFGCGPPPIPGASVTIDEDEDGDYTPYVTSVNELNRLGSILNPVRWPPQSYKSPAGRNAINVRKRAKFKYPLDESMLNIQEGIRQSLILDAEDRVPGGPQPMPFTASKRIPSKFTNTQVEKPVARKGRRRLYQRGEGYNAPPTELDFYNERDPYQKSGLGRGTKMSPIKMCKTWVMTGLDSP